MDSLLKISIITATYNSLETLPNVLKSIKEQNFYNFEWIIIDGNSTDGTLDFIHQQKKEIAFWKSEPDDGIYEALNKGIQFATGNVICFLHSDDIFATSKVLKNVINIFNNNDVDGVYGDLQYVNKTNTNKVIRNWKSCNFHPNLLNKGWMLPHPTLFLKREVYEKHGDFDLSYKIAADYYFMLRILKDDTLKFYYLPKVITKMRVGGTSNRSLKNIIQKTKEDYRAITTNKVGGVVTTIRKNTSKIKQFFIK